MQKPKGNSRTNSMGIKKVPVILVGTSLRFKKNIYLFLFYMYEYLPACMHIHNMCVMASRSQKKMTLNSSYSCSQLCGSRN